VADPGDRLAARVAAHCRRHGLLPAGAPVLAMVSGGADSLCLMHLLPRLHDGPVGVLAVDHGLRPEAAGEAARVAEAAAALGLRAHVVALALEAGPGVQARARDARYAAARRVAAEEDYARIATGHTASDQAETVLFRMARGTGRTGALGMAPRSGDLIRPLLVAEAHETREWCAARGLDPVRDPANDDPRHARPRVRHGLLPALADVHPAAARHVAAFAAALRDEAALLDPLVDAAWGRAARAGGLDVAALRREPEPMRRLLVRRLAAGAGLPGDALAADPVARALALLDGGGAVALPGDGRAEVLRGVLRIEGPPPAAPPAGAPLGVPGRVPFGAVAVVARPGEGVAPGPDRVSVRDAGPLHVRPPRAGDRLALPGGGRVAVGRLLAGAGVPARLRPHVPVVAAGDRVVWVAGHRAAGDLLTAGPEPGIVLELERA
jgi:tRNA(Ile)-lysidine synthase